MGQLILVMAGLTLFCFDRFKLSGGMTLRAVHTALSMLAGLRHSSGLNGHSETDEQIKECGL